MPRELRSSIALKRGGSIDRGLFLVSEWVVGEDGYLRLVTLSSLRSIVG